ncbi:unnamed protein product [Rhizopus microsporus]
MGETALIQNNVENNHIKAVTDSFDVLQSEVPSDAGDRTNEVLTSITNTVTNVNELRQLLSANEDAASIKYKFANTKIKHKKFLFIISKPYKSASSTTSSWLDSAAS